MPRIAVPLIIRDFAMRATRALLCFIIALMRSDAVELPKLRLNNGREMPALALGTYLGFHQIFPRSDNTIPETTNLLNVILEAVDVGYRHFDTASIYETEKEIGEAVCKRIKEGAVSREEIFITTKLWNTHHRREQVAEALRKSLIKLGLNYVDLYLMHWPMGLNEDNTYSDVDYMETWRGLEDIVALGLAKSIGLSNFNKDQLRRVMTESTIKPAVLQIEVHLQNRETDLVNYAQSQGLVVMGYSPFGSLVARHGYYYEGPKLDNPVLTAIAKKYNKTVIQVVLRWLIQRNIVPIPKTVKVKRLRENIGVFDFNLSKEDIEQINNFDTHTRYTNPFFWKTHPYYPFNEDTIETPNRIPAM